MPFSSASGWRLTRGTGRKASGLACQTKASAPSSRGGAGGGGYGPEGAKGASIARTSSKSPQLPSSERDAPTPVMVPRAPVRGFSHGMLVSLPPLVRTKSFDSASL